jgi:hypothetical protein
MVSGWCSRRESARIIAEGSGETPTAVECKIRRGEKEIVRHGDAPEENPTKPACKPDLEKLEKPIPGHGGARKGREETRPSKFGTKKGKNIIKTIS